jgi:hypothetical protein
VLKEFIHGFDFLRMRPDSTVVQGTAPANVRARALSQPGEQYAVYFFGGKQAEVSLKLPGGEYRGKWIDPHTGRVEQEQEFAISPEGTVKIASPPYREDVALRLVRKGRE